MIKWGTTFGSHDGALAVFVDDELVFASDAERWSRKKNDSIIPDNLIEFAENNWGVPEIVYFYEDLNLKAERRKHAGQKPLGDLNFKYPVVYGNHHKSHARYGYYTSPFIDCTVLVIDAIGEWNTMTQWKVKDDDFTLIK
jgi:carbamoyltransferase